MVCNTGLKRYIFFILAVLTYTFASAQTVTVRVPDQVYAGENFRLTYTVRPNKVKDFSVGNMPSSIEIVAGPYQSEESSYQVVNGHASSSSSITYTFVLSAKKTGRFTIPAATVWLSGSKTIHSAKRTIRVVQGAGGSGSGGNSSSQQNSPQVTHEKFAGEPITSKDLFIKATVNKHRVYEQEPIELTYKVYTTVDLTQLDIKMPDVSGFLTEEIELPRNKSFHIENIGGRNYKCVVWSKYLLYPQKSGSLTVPSLTFNAMVMQRNKNVNPFEALLNGGSGYVEVKKQINTPSITLTVDPLPNRPDNFSGGVGEFDISASFDKNEVRANDAATLKVVIKGRGNMKLINCPEPQFPKDFDIYDPKTTEDTHLTDGGTEGTTTYSFLVVPRNMGRYEIPPLEFTYFDSSEKKYKTLTTEKLTLNVLKGDGKSSSVDDFSDIKDRDIHDIKKGDVERRSSDDLFFASYSYWAVLIITSVIFIALLIIFRRRAIENADIVKLKGKRANKVAVKRLRKADKLMKEGRDSEFFDEVLRALWGYVSDKLDMPSEQLLRDNVEGKLSDAGVGQTTIEKFINALDECEFERYAPGDKSVNMTKTFESAMTAIMEIETHMKNKKSRKKVSSLAVLLILMLVPCTMSAVTKAEADAHYTKGNYAQAVTDYETLLKQGESADIYYNLGNAYYRANNMTKAVINYERALLLSPGDGDIRFNLQMARSKTIDKMAPESEMFFVTMYRALVNITSVDGWANTAVASIILSLILVLLYLFSSRIAVRKVGFFGSLALIVLFLASNLFAYQQMQQIIHRNGAVVITRQVEVKKTPSEGSARVHTIHEGTRVDIKDDTMKEWYGVHLSDGTDGWVKRETVEVI